MLERAAFAAAQVRAQSKRDLPRLFDIEKVAGGVYAAVARGRAMINSNAVIFENANGLLIVDAHAAPSAVYALAAQIRREITQKPVRYVVATHLHGDHTQGLPAYKSLAPGAELVSSTKTHDLLTELGPRRLKTAVTELVPRSIENYRARLAEAKTSEEKAFYEEMIRQSKAFLEEMQNVAIEAPNVTFDRELVLHDKAHDLHLGFHGRGHTAGDVVVFCPQKKVIATGDLLHGFFPVIGDGYPRDWPGTLASIGGLAFDRVAGGHGGVQQSPARLGHLRAYLEELIEVVSRAKRDGVPLERLQETVLPASLKTLEQGGYGSYLVSETKSTTFASS